MCRAPVPGPHKKKGGSNAAFSRKNLDLQPQWVFSCQTMFANGSREKMLVPALLYLLLNL